jgi:hypothetical protein
MTKWKSRNELPVLKRLGLSFDVQLLTEAFEEMQAKRRKWDSLGAEYAALCETHTRLPKMFFKSEELEGVSHVCDLDWENTSYKQMTLTEFEPSYSLAQRLELSGSAWDQRIAKHQETADERWYRKISDDTPDYFRHVINSIPGAHRTRFARLSPGSSVKPHIDYDTTYGIRLHIALATNEACVNGGQNSRGEITEEHIPADGSVWFVNPGVKHWAHNQGDSFRDHLIISVDSQNPLLL